MTKCFLLCAFVAFAGSAHAQTVGVYADPQGTNCNLQIPLHTSATFYVVYTPAPAVDALTVVLQGAISAAGDYQVVSATPHPSAQVISGSDPLAGSVTLAFQPCLPSNASAVLYTLVVENVSDVAGNRTVTMGGEFRRCDNPLVISNLTGKVSPLNAPVSPAVATYTAPSDGAQVAEATSVTVSWSGNAVRNACLPYEIYYRVWYGLTPDTPFSPGTTPASSANLTVHAQTTYYWRVETIRDSPLQVVSGPVWSFTTGSIPPPECLTQCLSASGCPGVCFTTLFASACGPGSQGHLELPAACAVMFPVYSTGDYDLTTGRISVEAVDCFEGTNRAEIMVADRFHITGPPSATPIAFTAKLDCNQILAGALHEGLVGPEWQPHPPDGDVVLPLVHAVGEEFVLTYGAGLWQSLADCELRFEGLPAGYTMQSCGGYHSTVRVQPASWTQLKTLYR